MQGIREAAMSQEKPEYETKSYPRQTSLYEDEYNPTKKELDRYCNDEEIDYYDKEKKNKTIITMYIGREELEDTLERYYVDYNWDPVEAKAIEIGYKRIKKLLNKDFDLNYQVFFSSMEGLDEVELTITLTKITS